MAEATAPQFTSRITKQGASFDELAKAAYGDQNYVRDLMNDNPHLAYLMQLPSGIEVFYRLLENPTTGELMPIWLSDDEETGTDDPNSPPPIPVVDGPGAVLGFSEGYPKVVNNHLEVAINKNITLPYYFKKPDGTVIAQSVGYPFSAGFPISMPDVVDGGYYFVQVGTLTSGLFTLPGTGVLAFAQTPTITKVGNTWQLKYSLNKTGGYQTTLTRLNDSTTPVNQTANYTKEFVVTYTISATGNYKLLIDGVLEFNFSITAETESTEVPAELLGLAYRYDANSHEITFLLDMTEPLEMNVKAAVGTNPSGKDQDNIAWNSGTYNKGRSDYVSAPWDRRYSFNPNVSASGGMLPNTQYELRIRPVDSPGEVFLFLFRTPSSSTGSTAVEVELDTQDTACTVRPVILELTADTDSMTFVVSGQGYKTLKWRIKDAGGAVIRSTTIIVFDDQGNAKFSPANQITQNYSPLVDADYTVEIEGGNCTSTPHSTAFEVTNYGGDATEDLEIALIYDDSGDNALKVRLAGNAPYSVIATDGTDEIFNVSGQTSDVIEIDDAIMADLDAAEGLLMVTAIDADGKTGSISRYKADRDNMKGSITLISVADGTPANHKAQIDQAVAKGLKVVAVVCGAPDTDAKFNILTGTPYNHETTSTFAYDFDETVRYAWQQGIKLKVGLPLDRDNTKLNNGTTRTKMFGDSALIKRPDGVTPIDRYPESGNPIPVRMSPSPSHPDTIDYGQRFASGFNKRYKLAVQKNVIAFENFTFSSSAEGEYPSYMHAGDISQTSEGAANGDFNAACVARYKVKYPAYEGKTPGEIAAFDLNGSPEALSWDEHLAQEIGRFERLIWDKVRADHPDLNRNGLESIDVGSRFDSQSARRRTRNMAPRKTRYGGLFKFNDESNQGAGRMQDIFDICSGFAQFNSMRTVWEMSPAGGSFSDSTNRGYIVAGMNMLDAIGGDFSFVNHDSGNIQYFLDNTNVDPDQLLPHAKECYEIDGDDKHVIRLLRKVSDIFKTGVEGGWETALNTFKTANSLTTADTLEDDDLNTVVDPGPDPGDEPIPSPGTGIFSPTVMYMGFEEVLTVTVTGASGSHSENWIINVTTNQVPGPEYQFYWLVDDVPYVQAGLITNIPYQSNEPVGVELMMQKTSGGPWYKWANPNEGPYIEGYSDVNLGQSVTFEGTSGSGAMVVVGFQEVSA